eukprot:271510_1
MIQYLNYTGSQNLANRNGAIIAFDYDVQWVQQFVEDWKDCAMVKACIAPQGSSRANHRQDQAALTLLFYQYNNIYHFKMVKCCDGCYGAQQDIHCNVKTMRADNKCELYNETQAGMKRAYSNILKHMEKLMMDRVQIAIRLNRTGKGYKELIVLENGNLEN